MTTALLACQVFEHELRRIDLPGLFGESVDVYYVEMGLHTDHQELRENLEGELERLAGEYDTIVLAYGQCHPEMQRITREYGATYLDAQNCIEAFLGKEINEIRGYFYLSPGWIENWQDVLDRMDWDREEARLNYGLFKAALYLDTVGDAGEREEEFLEFFEYTMLPVETKNTTLNNLEELLGKAYNEARR